MKAIWFGLHPDNKQRWRITCGLCFQDLNRSKMVMGHSVPGNGFRHTQRPRSIMVYTYDDAVVCVKCHDLMEE